MRHNNSGRKLQRTHSHRRALFASLATQLILHKKIRTTLAKAKEMRTVVEPIITRARRAHASETGGTAKDVHARRVVGRLIKDADAITALFGEIVEKIGARQGGYTRVVKLGRRYGDGAEMAVLELVDWNLEQDTGSIRRRTRQERVEASRRKQTAAASAPAA